MRNIYFKILAFSLVYTLLPFSPALYESLGKGYAAQHSETSKLVTLIADDDPSLAPAFPDNAPSILPQACVSRMCMENEGGNVSIAGFALTRHAIARMSERNVSTSQVRTALVSGKRKWDPRHGSIIYTKNGIHVATTGKIVKTVMTGRPSSVWMSID